MVSALAEAEKRARHAKADVLDEQAAAVREETARRQTRLTELAEEIRVRQQEAHDHGGWIANAGPLKRQQFEAEASACGARRDAANAPLHARAPGGA